MIVHLYGLRRIALDFFDLLYPRLCPCCDYHEAMYDGMFCMQCLADLPVTYHARQADNSLEQQFWGRIKVEHAASAYYFLPEGRTQKLLHNLKYNDRKDVGRYIGFYFGKSLKQWGRFDAVHSIVPVPLHERKQRQRGYNQSTAFASGLSGSLQKPVVANALKRTRDTSSQTSKSRLERLANITGAFEVENIEAIRGHHVLLVDDVLTTGATLEACSIALQQVPNVCVSIATIASGRI